MTDHGTAASSVTFDVVGLAAPQGSKRHVGGGRMVESSKKVKPWRAAVEAAGMQVSRGCMTGPVELLATFYLPRPKGHLGTGRNTGTVRPSAPRFPAVVPDLDKLLRSTFDGITSSGIWGDDAQVVRVLAAKAYADNGRDPGARITIRSISQEA